MAPRRYQQTKRAEAAEETRRRIVEATFALHSEQGIEATTMKQIAERADVSVGTVYHHFPSYEDCIRACGEYTMQLVPVPDESFLEGTTDQHARLYRLAYAWFDYYARSPGLDEVRVLRKKFRVIEQFMLEMEQYLDHLVALTLNTTPDDSRIAPIAATLDVAAYMALTRHGFDTSNAAAQVADLLHAWLKPRPFPRHPDAEKKGDFYADAYR